VKARAISITAGRPRVNERLLATARSRRRIDIKQDEYEVNMTQATDTDIREIKDLIAALDKKIDVGFSDIRGEFKEVRGQVNTVEAKLSGKIDQLDERTKLGFWGFIFRGTALAALAALTAIFVKYLFPILPTELPKL
jgi:hypothetical protein